MYLLTKVVMSAFSSLYIIVDINLYFFPQAISLNSAVSLLREACGAVDYCVGVRIRGAQVQTPLQSACVLSSLLTRRVGGQLTGCSYQANSSFNTVTFSTVWPTAVLLSCRYWFLQKLATIHKGVSLECSVQKRWLPRSRSEKERGYTNSTHF